MSEKNKQQQNGQQQEPANRFHKLFPLDRIAFKASDSDRRFTSKDGSAVSQKLAAVLVEIGDSGAFLRASIYGRQKRGQKAPIADFSWFGANMITAIVTDDPIVRAEMDQWKGQVVRKYVDWRKAHASTAAAETPAVTLDDLSIAFE